MNAEELKQYSSLNNACKYMALEASRLSPRGKDVVIISTGGKKLQPHQMKLLRQQLIEMVVEALAKRIVIVTMPIIEQH